MKKRLSWLVLSALLFSISFPFAIEAHPGRTDRNGGHYVRTAGWGYSVGSYHYHNGGPAKQDPEENKDEILKIQQKLNELGFDCGEPDGIMGSKTEQAIKDFQTSKGLEPDGVVGPKTKEALGV
jgi:hypothetical protein